MKSILIFATAIALTGCGGPNLSRIQSDCGAGKVAFIESWPCVRDGIAKVRVSADLREAYVATGDIVAERVRAGEMTDAEARLVMAKARQEAINMEGSRNTDRAIRAALLAPKRAPAFVPPPNPIPPTVTTNCYRAGNTVNCTTY